MPEWIDNFEHESLSTPEARESFTKTMGLYETQEQAIIGGYEAKKLAGRPFKLPESMDNVEHWPDENDRKTFKSGLSKLMGVVESEDAIPQDFNFAEGLEQGQTADENLVKAFKQFAVQNKFTLSQMQEGVKFWNAYQASVRQAVAQQAQQTIQATQQKILAAYNNDEGAYKADIELFKRTLKNHGGPNGQPLPNEEYEAIGDEISSIDENGKPGPLFRNPTLTLSLLRLLAPMSKEGTNDTGTGAPPEPPKKDERTWGQKEGIEKTEKALWGVQS